MDAKSWLVEVNVSADVIGWMVHSDSLASNDTRAPVFMSRNLRREILPLLVWEYNYIHNWLKTSLLPKKACTEHLSPFYHIDITKTRNYLDQTRKRLWQTVCTICCPILTIITAFSNTRSRTTLNTQRRRTWQEWRGAESSLPVAHPGYQVLSDILFRLGLIANALTQCSA